MPQYILILEAVLVPGLDGVLVKGKVKGDHYVHKSNINIHAFALNRLESKLRAARLQNRFDIQAQIRRKEEEEEFRKELKRREAVAAEQAEAAYQGKISALMKEAEPQQYFPRKSAKWFT